MQLVEVNNTFKRGYLPSWKETEGNEECVEGHMRINEARSIGLDTMEASQRNVAFAS
jgi:hypothetical protein